MLRSSRFDDLFRVLALSLLATTLLVLRPTPAPAQIRKHHRTPTELVVLRYEKLIADGSLLSSEGWERSAKLFDRTDPYLPDSEISLMSTGELLAENWVKGDRAMVGTKWGDFYGTIDAGLRYKPPTPSGSIMMGSEYFLVFARSDSETDDGNGAGKTTPTGEWKIEGPQRTRAATPEQAIIYLTRKLEESSDPVLRKNAARAINSLKRAIRGRGAACAC